MKQAAECRFLRWCGDGGVLRRFSGELDRCRALLHQVDAVAAQQLVARQLQRDGVGGAVIQKFRLWFGVVVMGKQSRESILYQRVVENRSLLY